MKMILRKPPEPPKAEEAEVSCDAMAGAVRLHIVYGDARRDKDAEFDPAQAVKLWRCLMGEYDTATPVDVHGDTYKLWCHDHPNLDEVWELTGPAGGLFCIDADQAMALAWSIQDCCRKAIYGGVGRPATHGKYVCG